MRERILVRGGGDIATGTIYHLYRCGFRVLILECARPSAIRRRVAFCEAVYDGMTEVEGVVCRKIETLAACEGVWQAGEIPLLVDEEADSTGTFEPKALVDGLLAKRNLGTRMDMAPLTIGLGPGFTAGVDVHAVIETMRGHDLGRIISQGQALPNTGVPGLIEGRGQERVIHASAGGIIRNRAEISDLVEKGQVIAYIDDMPVKASLTGVLRGIIRDGFHVKKGLKIADIDPRGSERKNCFTISDKARCIAGSVGEVILHDLYGSCGHQSA